jgi:dTDP-glucose 4,6-dehydratase
LNDGRVLPAFIGQALRGEDLTVFGDGSQTRSFCYVDDLVEGIYRLLLSDYAGPVNVGNPEKSPLRSSRKRSSSSRAPRRRSCTSPLPTDDPKQRQPDITLARKLLGWEPKVTVPKGCGLPMITSVP